MNINQLSLIVLILYNIFTMYLQSIYPYFFFGTFQFYFSFIFRYRKRKQIWKEISLPIEFLITTQPRDDQGRCKYLRPRECFRCFQDMGFLDICKKLASPQGMHCLLARVRRKFHSTTHPEACYYDSAHCHFCHEAGGFAAVGPDELVHSECREGGEKQF